MDQGSQERASDDQDLLEKHEIVGSMSAKGCRRDNAGAGSFYSTLKLASDLDDHRDDLISPQPLQRDLARWIEACSNRECCHSMIGYHSLIEDEQRFVACTTVVSVNS